MATMDFVLEQKKAWRNVLIDRHIGTNQIAWALEKVTGNVWAGKTVSDCVVDSYASVGKHHRSCHNCARVACGT